VDQIHIPVSTSLAAACAAADRALLAKEEVGPQLIAGVVRLVLAIDRHAQVPTVPAANAVPYRRSSELIPILAHKGSGQPQADADFAIGADEHTLGGNAPDNIFGGQRPAGGCPVMASKLCRDRPACQKHPSRKASRPLRGSPVGPRDGSPVLFGTRFRPVNAAASRRVS
jgi:hypothetical protein